MNDTICKFCGSDNICIHKKTGVCECEDCGKSFLLDEMDKIEPQKVFLSYGHDDNAKLVEIIKDKLIARGHEPWIDRSEIKAGDEWRIKITDGIQKSSNFIAFISKYSTRIPGVCLNEIRIGLGSRNCRIQTVLLEQDVQVPQSIRKIQWLDMSEWKKYYELGGEQWEKWINTKTELIYGIVESPENKKAAGEIVTLEKILNPGKLNELKLSLMLSNMKVERKWLISEIEGWYKKDNSKVFFLLGNPGSGKSVISAYLSNFLIDCAAVYFFEYDNADTHSIFNFVKNIIFQLACSITDYRNQVVKILDNYSFDNKNPKTIFEDLLALPLNKLIDGNREKAVIVLDALDEIPESERNEFYSFLNSCIKEMPSWIRWIITSRPESEAINKMSGYAPFIMEMNKAAIFADIKEYILNELPGISREALDRIVSGSEGSFMYARALIDGIDSSKNIDEQIKNIPNGMNEMYLNGFSRLFGQGTYDEKSRVFLSVITAAFEPVKKNYMMEIMQTDEEEFCDVLSRFSSYVICDENSSGSPLLFRHKSVRDWLVSEKATQYRIFEKKAHKIISNNIISLKRDYNNYEMEYAYWHLISSDMWNEQTEDFKKKVLNNMILASRRYAALDNEKTVLQLYAKLFDTDYKYTVKYLSYAIRSNEDINLKQIADNLMESIEKVGDEKERFLAVMEVATAYFYCGEDRKSQEILEKETAMHSEEFWKDDENIAEYNHVLGLSAHDLDLNEKVYRANNLASGLYKKNNKKYDYYITLVNLFDAAMGIGKLDEAEKTALKVYELNDEEYYVHVADILDLCYGNLLLEQGRLMEALQYYETGLILAKDKHEWDYIYGSIWRELAIAKFGDPSCFESLLKYKEMAKAGKYDYLESLADCFYLLAMYLFGRKFDVSDIGNDSPDTVEEVEKDISENNMMCSCAESIWEDLKAHKFPGHMLQGAIACEMSGRKVLTDGKIAEIMKQCEGVKGCPEIIKKWYEKSDENRYHNNSDIEDWIKKYVAPIVKYQEEYRESLLKDISELPLTHNYTCAGCEAKCCYDGVYINAGEEKTILEFVAKNKENFTDLPADFIIDGTWPGMEDTRKTATVPHKYSCSDFPAHFEKTRCVFANEDGYCRLQIVATKKQLHPWHAKPRACWSFPIGGIRKGQIIPPPKTPEEDINNIGPEYPGYVSCLECAKHYEDGTPWKYKYANEIEYYDFLKRKGKL